MNKLGLHILRIGLGINFLIVGAMIWNNPEGWGGLILPWARELLPGSIEVTMKMTAIFDVVLGLLLILNIWTWGMAALAALHLVQILITTGINSVTVRDIGLLAASAALLLFTLPARFKR